MYDGSEQGYFGGASASEVCAAVAERVREVLGVGPSARAAGEGEVPGPNPGLRDYPQTPASEGTAEDPDSVKTAEHEEPAEPPVSARKLAANRANAAKSTGPRSAAGKERAKLNAVKHGLWATTSLLAGESAEELAALADAFDADHGGGSAAERELAARAVSISWRLRRLARAEERLADEAAERRRARMPFGGGSVPEDWPDGAQVTADDFAAGSPTAGRLQQLMAAEGRLSGQLTSVCRLLLKARAAA